MVYLCHWENQNTFTTSTGNITQLKEFRNLTMHLLGFFSVLCLEKKTHFLIDWSVERRGFQTFVPCFSGWAPGCFCCLSGKKVFPQWTVFYADSFFFRSPQAPSLLNFVWHPQTVKSFITQDTHHWAAVDVNCLLEIAWSSKIQVYQDINFMMFKTELKRF